MPTKECSLLIGVFFHGGGIGRASTKRWAACWPIFSAANSAARSCCILVRRSAGVCVFPQALSLLPPPAGPFAAAIAAAVPGPFCGFGADACARALDWGLDGVLGGRSTEVLGDAPLGRAERAGRLLVGDVEAFGVAACGGSAT